MTNAARSVPAYGLVRCRWRHTRTSNAASPQRNHATAICGQANQQLDVFVAIRLARQHELRFRDGELRNNRETPDALAQPAEPIYVFTAMTSPCFDPNSQRSRALFGPEPVLLSSRQLLSHFLLDLDVTAADINWVRSNLVATHCAEIGFQTVRRHICILIATVGQYKQNADSFLEGRKYLAT